MTHQQNWDLNIVLFSNSVIFHYVSLPLKSKMLWVHSRNGKQPKVSPFYMQLMKGQVPNLMSHLVRWLWSILLLCFLFTWLLFMIIVSGSWELCVCLCVCVFSLKKRYDQLVDWIRKMVKSMWWDTDVNKLNKSSFLNLLLYSSSPA